MPLTITCPGCRSTLRVRDDYAGREMKCPRCSATVHVTAEAPTGPEVVEAVTPSRAAHGPDAATKTCPACGKRIALSARKCRFCRSWLEEDDEDQPRSYFVPCPRCGAEGAQRMLFTFWGSFYGPAMFHHVRCPDCGYAYNGKTGRSNVLPAIVFVMIPALGILAILGCLTAVLVGALGGK
jgi:DNA-directed RNA polymerase subunit M/transcription elongation factor TFIIS